MSDTQIDMEYTLNENAIGDQPPLRAGEIYAQYDAKRAEFVRDSQGLTLVTLCDMVLGEDATDRSDDALVRAVGTLKRECNKAQARSGAKSIAMEDLRAERDAALIEAGQLRLRLERVTAGATEWSKRAEQAEADRLKLARLISSAQFSQWNATDDDVLQIMKRVLDGAK